MSQKVFVLDASPMLNILGSGSAERVLTALSGKCVIEENTLKEVIRNPFDSSPAAPVIKHLFEKKCLRVTRMGSDAYEEYLELVSANSIEALGRGESAALCLAKEIGGLVVLDDRKAKRIGGIRFPECEQLTSMALLRRASETGKMSRADTARIVENAVAKARMHVVAEDRKWLRELGF